MDQISLFDSFIKVGDYVKEHGDIIPFEKLCNMIGCEVILDNSTESKKWYKVIRLEKLCAARDSDGKHIIFNDGKRIKGSISEYFYINHGRYNGRFPSICYFMR